MTEPKNELLYDLLPVVYRQRDVALGEPLRAFLQLIEGEYRLVETNIGELYNNWFIETCDEWVVPYIADLLGVRGLSHGRDYTSTERSRVANTIGYRRRKGLAAVLEHAAQDSTGWAAHVVEYFELLSTTQQLNHVRAGQGGTADLRDAGRMAAANTPFDTLARTAAVRGIAGKPWRDALESAAERGKYNIGNVGLYLWRLRSYPVTNGAPRPLAGPPDGRYRGRPIYFSFHPLGDDDPAGGHTFPLFNRPLTETSITQSSDERDVPEALRREPLRAELDALRAGLRPGTDYFDPADPVLRVFTLDDTSPPGRFDEIDPTEMTVGDLGDWGGLVLFRMLAKYQIELDLPWQASPGPVPAVIRGEFEDHGVVLSPRATVEVGRLGNLWYVVDPLDAAGDRKTYVVVNTQYKLDVYEQSIKVAIDPVTGRLMFPPYAPPAAVRVTFNYGLAGDVGGGPYERRGQLAAPGSDAWVARVYEDAAEATIAARGASVFVFNSLRAALDAWQESGRDGIIQIGDDATYALGASDACGGEAGFQAISLAEDQRLVIEAGDGASPCVTGKLCLTSTGEGARLTLNGLWIDGIVRIASDLHLDVRHCTIKPRRRGTRHDEPKPDYRSADVPPDSRGSSAVSLPGLYVTIANSIVGRLCLPANALSLSVIDSVVDGGGGGVAVSGSDEGGEGSVIVVAPPVAGAAGLPGPASIFRRSTVFGEVFVTEIAAASDSIFTGRVTALNRESGGVRFSYAPLRSALPPLYRAQPWLYLHDAQDAKKHGRAASAPPAPPHPVFTSTKFGDAGYAQLALECPREIQNGAENGAEMGVFNFLHQPQRAAELRIALAEYLPFGHEAGVFYVN